MQYLIPAALVAVFHFRPWVRNCQCFQRPGGFLARAFFSDWFETVARAERSHAARFRKGLEALDAEDS